jgi:hypothetical protein
LIFLICFQKTTDRITAAMPVVMVRYAKEEKAGGRLLINMYAAAQHSVIENSSILFSAFVIRSTPQTFPW